MKPSSPIERALTADASAARRAPPARLRASILGQLDAEAAPRVETESVRERSRFVRPLLAVAAGVLIAGLVWLATRADAPPPVQTASNASPTPERTSDVKSALSSLRPGVAIDGPLLAEAENLSRDTTRATRYLLDRVTTPFLPRGTPR
jgi:hypothetical protein